MKSSIYVGFDPREAAAYAVTRHSLRRHLKRPMPVEGLVLSNLRSRRLYRRPTWHREIDGTTVMWDVISGAPMSTEHANARFLTKELACGDDWALFMDGDVLIRGDVSELFETLDPAKALYCVQHEYDVGETKKMDGQVQTTYSRKNWSSVFVINPSHPSNRALTVDMINELPGRDLHRFCWLEDNEIGSLPLEWNYLISVSPPIRSPIICHFTLGTPDLPGYHAVEYADEWREELHQWAR